MTYKGKIDNRTADRYIEKGLLKQSEVDSHLKNLPDDAANAEYVQVALEDTDLGDTDDDTDDEAEETVEE